MGEIEDIAAKIVNSYEDLYFDREKKDIFDTLFTRYLTMVPLDEGDVYEAVVSLGRAYRSEFDQMVKALKERSLIQE